MNEMVAGELMFLAHGVGTRADLPVSATLAAVGAGLVLVISFVVLGLLWRKPKLAGGTGGWPLRSAGQTVLDAPVLRVALQGLTLAAVVLVCVVGLTGPQAIEHNMAPWVLYIIFWVGLVPASLLLGPIWRVINPIRLVHKVLAAALRLDPIQGAITLPERVGYWPAALSLTAFAWFELVYPSGSEPVTVAVFVLGYTILNTVAALLVGHRWFERGDGFEVYSALLGAMAPIGPARTGGSCCVTRWKVSTRFSRRRGWSASSPPWLDPRLTTAYPTPVGGIGTCRPAPMPPRSNSSAPSY